MPEPQQKELANGELWFKLGEDIPNVDKKLFALQKWARQPAILLPSRIPH